MKKVSIIIFLILILCCSIILINSSFYERKIISNTKTENILNTNSLTMMYETDYQSGEYQVSSDSEWPQDGYTFNETLSKCENGSTLIWNDENKRVILQANVSDKCYVYFDFEPTLADLCAGKTLAVCITNYVYVSDGVNDLYYHDGVGSYVNANQEAGDNSYRYSGANPNNYVCFGSDTETCPTDNLYRIIGIFNNQVKMIKGDYTKYDLLGTDGEYIFSGDYLEYDYYKGSINANLLGIYSWNSNNSNKWSDSRLNTTNLNLNFINNFENKWQNLIAETTWYLGGMTSYSNTAKAFYDGERSNVGNGSNSTTYSDEIGLMYPSDYGYAVSPDYWNITLNNYKETVNYNWLYMGLYEWTITRVNSNHDAEAAYIIDDVGCVTDTPVFRNDVMMVRPSFYLNFNVQYISGTGTQSDPYRIN